jgi:hypothetical protein
VPRKSGRLGGVAGSVVEYVRHKISTHKHSSARESSDDERDRYVTRHTMLNSRLFGSHHAPI